MTDSETQTFKALWVTEQRGDFERQIVERQIDDLPAGDLLIRVHYSSLNYKDALSAYGNRGVTRQYPHTPGIDAVGQVVSSSVAEYAVGDTVIVSGYDLGMNTCGGLGQYIRVPCGWAVPLPAALSAADAMAIGTAGFTAALSVQRLLDAGAKPDAGDVLVTGATGGVGSIAINLLAQLGFNVIASTGKLDSVEFLTELGASQIIDRATLAEFTNKPMTKGRWTYVVDTVAGDILANALKATNYGGLATCCGMCSSNELNSSIFPFILRGISLLGVDCVELPLSEKQALWQRLATDLKPSKLPMLTKHITLDMVPSMLDRIHRGKALGRTLVDMT